MWKLYSLSPTFDFRQTITMHTASVKELKDELAHYPSKDLVAVILRLAKFKKENKELLTYLLFETQDEEAFIKGVKLEMDELFTQINTRNYYYIKKSVRKILRQVKKRIRYSGKKETEVELLLYFCRKLKAMDPPMARSRVLRNIYERQLSFIRGRIGKLHEDLQYDFERELERHFGP